MDISQTKGLFLELNYDDKSNCVYTLKDEDHTLNSVTYPSISRIYMDIADVTEYEFAMECFCSWNHWVKIQKSPEVKPYIQKWRDELEIKVRSGAIKHLIKQSKSDKGTAAAKYIADKKWIKREAGAPTKAEKKKHLDHEALITEGIKADMKRAGELEH